MALARGAVALLAMMQVMMLALPAYLDSNGVDAAQQLLLNWASLSLTLPVMLLMAYNVARTVRGGKPFDAPIPALVPQVTPAAVTAA